MTQSILVDIIQNCLSLEGTAIKAYRHLAEQSTDKEHRTFWKTMSNQEKDHVMYWSTLLDLANKGKIHNVFDNPEKVKRELEQVQKELDNLICHIEKIDTPSKAFHLAYRLEFVMMHPALEAMFFLMKDITDSSPEDQYRAHIHGLIEMMKKQGQENAEFELIADLMDRVWDNNQQLAKQLADIKTLRGFIPICMHCKNVRNDKGFWGKVESYIEDHSEAQFSHGICPDCMKKYYGEIMDDV